MEVRGKDERRQAEQEDVKWEEEQQDVSVQGPGLGHKIREAVVGRMEDWFQAYGELVARRPWSFIFGCLVLTAVSGLGLLWFRAENEGIKLWIPENSDYRINNDWLFDNFPREVRYSSMFLVGENVLVPEVVQAMYRISRGVAGLRNRHNDTWETMCVRRPVMAPPSLSNLLGRRKRAVSNETDGEFFDAWDEDFFENDDEEEKEEETSDELGGLGNKFSVSLYPQPYCSIASSLKTACFETSLLELWGHDGLYDQKTEEEINNLTQERLLEKVNSVGKSGIFLLETNFTKFLSGLEYDTNGRIVGARATVMRWFAKMNMTAAKLTPAPGRGEPIDPRTLEWEGDMLRVLLNTTSYPPGLEGAPNVMRSFGDIASSTILGDIVFFGGGYVMMFGYASIMLGRVNCLEQRSQLAVVGIIGVLMGIVVSYGISSALGLFYGPMHSVMPFLMLGIGIDDMFVIAQCWETLDARQKTQALHTRFGHTMRHAGTAITVTSVTDIIAFGVGGFTILPALKSFCVYASVGIVATFIFQSTFFVAWFSLDQRRLEGKRNACCPCIIHNDHRPNKWSQKNFMQDVFNQLGLLLTKSWVKITVLLFTATLLGVGIWGNLLLRQEFDPVWFLPPGTYLARWFDYSREYFPSQGEMGTIYFSETALPRELGKIEALVRRLENETTIVQDVTSWTSAYVQYVQSNSLVTSDDWANMNSSLFRGTLTQFLFSPVGAVYQNRFRFRGPLVCGKPAPDILLSEVTFLHRRLDGPEEQIPAMNAVKNAIRDSVISGRVFAFAFGYAAWETDEVIALEVYRNIALALVCVFFTTLFFICNLRGSVIIIICVVLTLVNVGGFMHFWGLTIDTVSCNNLIIAIGLCVDYSAHVTHRFLVEAGSRDARVVSTMRNIGPAVFNGGFSTFLAFILLAGSQSHVFTSFFKIFFLVVSFGLFHGLIFLPVLLSLIGPTFTREQESHPLRVL